MTLPDRVDLAERRAVAARRRLSETSAELQARLDPRTIARGAIGDIADAGELALRRGASAVRRHPGKVAGAVALVAAILGRRRLVAFVKRPNEAESDGVQPASAPRVPPQQHRPAPVKKDRL